MVSILFLLTDNKFNILICIFPSIGRKVGTMASRTDRTNIVWNVDNFELLLKHINALIFRVW